MAVDSDADEPSVEEEWAAAPPASNWRPPRAGATLAVLIVAVGCWLLADALGSLDALSIAAVGAAGFAGVIWLATRERFTPVWTLASVVVAPFSGVLLVAGLGYVGVAQFAGFAPQGAVFVGLGVALAAFGAAAIPGDAVDRGSVTTAARSSSVGVLLLVVVAGGLVGNTVRKEEELEPLSALPLPEELPSLFPETALTPPLGTVLLIGSLSLLALRAALTALPIAELLDDRSDDDEIALRLFERLLAALNAAQIGVVVGIVLLGARRLLGSAWTELWGRLPPVAADLLGLFATAEVVRRLSLRLIAVSVAVVVAVKLLRRLHRSGVRRYLSRVAPLVGGGAALAVGWVAHETILNVVLGRLEATLPASVASTVLEQAGTVIDYYSGEVVAVGLIALGGVAAVITLGLLRLGMAFRVVPGRHTGHALAAAGLLVTGGFAAAVGAPLLPALGAVVGAVVVWDLGGFGVDLGRDVGRRAPSLAVQFVRALTAALIGGVTVAAALAATSRTPSVSLAAETAAVLALFAAIGVAVLASLALAR
ncbi:hypothetical protein B4589_001005 [Halolamina sp. CBA1230]|uniref:DUF7519 family protein n=1 Tax=Halolamina sp. CBA1230 TaxID=1853690 RepID=UPI0009A139E7|nr:hypothetical protein [Halolamina sp. CBA1230]QKY19018.1 hypothetical protein B4589_001005 [Halolamina sp. CBA1230]